MGAIAGALSDPRRGKKRRTLEATIEAIFVSISHGVPRLGTRRGSINALMGTTLGHLVDFSSPSSCELQDDQKYLPIMNRTES